MDCIISGISLYTQNLLLVLAYCPVENDDSEEPDPKATSTLKGHKAKGSTASTGSEPSGGIRRRQNHEPPELRLIDLSSQAEVNKDCLTPMSRYERLAAGDYHLGVLPARNAASAAVSSKGALEALAGIGTDMWNVAINPKSLFSSGASVRSRDSGEDGGSSRKTGSPSGTIRHMRPGLQSVDSNLVKPGAKIFILSPYDCMLATKLDLDDRVKWLEEHERFQEAWELLDENQDVLEAEAQLERPIELPPPPTPTKSKDFHDDVSVADSAAREVTSVEKEKRRIGELWIQELIEEKDWAKAGQICGKVVKSADRWSKWIWTFVGAKKFDEIVDFIPVELMSPPIPTTTYEVVLGHYLENDKVRLRDLLDRWSTELFDITTVTTALENQLKYRDVREDSMDNGEKGRDWRIVMESLAKLHEANGRYREALKCFIRLHDADSAFRLIGENHLADAVTDDISGFISLRVSPDEIDQMTVKDFEVATLEAISLLVDESQHGLVRPGEVVKQLQAKRQNLYLYFYFKGLWRGGTVHENSTENRARLVQESQALVDEHADLVVHLFARYDREILADFLRVSTSYTFEKVCR